MLRPLVALPLATLLACTPSPADFLESCQDPDCRLQRVLHAFDADPDGALVVVSELEPVEQEALVRHLIETRPDALEAICRGLSSSSSAWGVCGRLQERPHLIRGRVTPLEPEQEQRPAPGPAGRHPPLPRIELVDLGDPANPRALPAACEPGGPCVDDVALGQLDRQAGIEPGQACYEGHVAGRQRGECLFRVAETLAQHTGWRAADTIVRLCVASGDFAHGCMHHAISRLLPPVPAADRAAPADIEESLQALAALREAVGPDVADAYTDFYWAIWTSHAFRHAENIDGRLLQLLPAEATPHVRMAAAYEQLRREGRAGWSDLSVLGQESICPLVQWHATYTTR